MKRAFRAIAAALLLQLAVSAPAQPLSPPPLNPQLAIERLANTGSVLLIAAHPDDERNDLLAYLALGRRLRTGYLSLTRGEGGQNVIGPEKGALLGVIRTQELLAARQIDGAEQYFTSAVDFGYSKTAEETLQKWNREKVLGEVVHIIREFQPDVILLRWTGTNADGHGHHQASAILGREAFDAAADPQRFPGDLKPWKAKRLMVLSRAKADVAVPVGSYDPLLGYSYTEIGGMARSQHHSQAMGSPQPVGAADVYLKNVAGEPARDDLMEGVTSGWPEPIRNTLTSVTKAFSPSKPYESVPALLQARVAISALKTDLAARKLRDLDELIARCSGLKVTALVDQPQSTAPANVRIEAINRSPIAMKLGLDGTVLHSNVLVTRYTGHNMGQPVALWFEVEGVHIQLFRPVVYRYVDRVLGERTQPFTIVPPVSVSFTESTILFPSDTPRDVAITVQAYSNPAKGSASLKLPEGWSSNPESAPFELSKAAPSKTITFRVTPSAASSVSEVTATVSSGGSFNSSVTVIRYPHIPAQTVIQPAQARFVRENIRILAQKIGYIEGAGDEVPDAIRQLGCMVTLLTTADLTSGDLNEYDAIVTGVRAFNLRDDLRSNVPRLNEYVRTGGTLIVQYNNADDVGTVGPYPITIGRGRVSVEEAPVRILNPKSPVMRFPNPITPADFSGWVQERGLYFPSKWDEHYEAPIESADPGENPLGGGILFTRYGEGAYIYTSYSWFRQLPAGVPGAYRIFANMLSQ